MLGTDPQGTDSLNTDSLNTDPLNTDPLNTRAVQELMTNEKRTGSVFLRFLQRLLQLGLIAAWLGIALRWLGSWHWALDLCSHFYLQFTAIALAGTVACIGACDKKILVIGVVAWLMLVPSALGLYFGSASPTIASTQNLRVVSCNVLTSNSNKNAVLEFLHQSEADIALLMEVDAEWSQAIRGLAEIYPHQLHEAREDNFGLVLLAKTAWQSAEIIRLDNAGIPSVEAMFEIGGKQLRFIGTHPLPPMGRDYSSQRNLHFVNLAKRVRESENSTPTVVVGDLNCTSWSHYFRKLLYDSKLRDSRQGFGIQRTWPTSMKLSILGSMRIPIDHALVSSEVSVTNRRVGPNIGSDHYPIIVDVGF
ncbi:MAG: endonuclease/exonuclease/phosphatase family protein [Pirellulaceae bacterium]|nr:endonuclease/exonuclease/phosphatase family protein [Pirellulaceae bacterium]